MHRGGKSIMAGDSKYSRVLSLLGLCHRCHVERTRLKLICGRCTGTEIARLSEKKTYVCNPLEKKK